MQNVAAPPASFISAIADNAQIAREAMTIRGSIRKIFFISDRPGDQFVEEEEEDILS